MYHSSDAFVQGAIGAVFAFSSITKVARLRSFLAGVSAYRLIPEPLVTPLGVGVVLLEALLSFSHLTSVGITILAPCGLALLLVLTCAVAINLKRGRVLPCYCTGSDQDEPISSRTLARLGLLIAAECYLIVTFAQSSEGSLRSPFAVATVPAFVNILVGTFIVLEAAAWFLRLADLRVLAMNLWKGRITAEKM